MYFVAEKWSKGRENSNEIGLGIKSCGYSVGQIVNRSAGMVSTPPTNDASNASGLMARPEANVYWP
jgi:hypothetical protein